MSSTSGNRAADQLNRLGSVLRSYVQTHVKSAPLSGRRDLTLSPGVPPQPAQLQPLTSDVDVPVVTQESIDVHEKAAAECFAALHNSIYLTAVAAGESLTVAEQREAASRLIEAARSYVVYSDGRAAGHRCVSDFLGRDLDGMIAGPWLDQDCSRLFSHQQIHKVLPGPQLKELDAALKDLGMDRCRSAIQAEPLRRIEVLRQALQPLAAEDYPWNSDGYCPAARALFYAADFLHADPALKSSAQRVFDGPSINLDLHYEFLQEFGPVLQALGFHTGKATVDGVQANRAAVFEWSRGGGAWRA